MSNGLSKDERKQLQDITPFVKQRVSISLALSSILLLGYVLYAYLLTGDGALGGQKVWGEMTLVIIASVAMVVLGVLTAGIYTWWCRNRLDPNMNRIREGKPHE